MSKKGNASSAGIKPKRLSKDEKERQKVHSVEIEWRNRVLLPYNDMINDIKNANSNNKILTDATATKGYHYKAYTSI